MDDKNEYTAACHLVVNGEHVWPDTEENRKLDRRTRVELTEAAARRYGTDLVKVPVIDTAKAVLETPQNKQVTSSRTK